ncbi:hypothetical protein CBM2626_A50205 [Cupriavidus taiwanensis]|nr:hypothetical protein CBM2626_A50205 [Cupriavidus taiwanensis]
MRHQRQTPIVQSTQGSVDTGMGGDQAQRRGNRSQHSHAKTTTTEAGAGHGTPARGKPGCVECQHKQNHSPPKRIPTGKDPSPRCHFGSPSRQDLTAIRDASSPGKANRGKILGCVHNRHRPLGESTLRPRGHAPPKTRYHTAASTLQQLEFKFAAVEYPAGPCRYSLQGQPEFCGNCE